MKEHFSSRVTKLLVILALAIVASVMFVFVGCGEQHVHTWTQTKEQAATCTADGFIEYTCEGCGDVRQETVQATGHVWKDDGALQTHPATCTEDGYYYKLCTVCEYEETSSRIPATGHTMAFADVTVTLPTCTADGSVTGKCADCGADITWTADEIAAGAKLTGIPEKNVTVGNKTTEYYPEAHDGVKAYFLQTLDHDYRFENNTHSCVTAFDNTYKAVFGDDAAKTASKYYWNYCDRCKTAFEVEEHSVPTGAVPCEVLINPNTTQPYPVPSAPVAPKYFTFDGTSVTDSAYAEPGSKEGYSYVCAECDNYIAAVGHDYQLMSLVSGTPNDPNDPAVWEAAPADATFSCEYYEVCVWCGTNRISAPHKPNAAAATCTEDVVCEECGAIMVSATGHETFISGKFGDFKDDTIAATCTTPEIMLTHCEACGLREQRGEDVEWVLGENYKETPNPDQPALGHKYEEEKVFDTTVTAIGCARPYWKQNVCSVCKEDVTGHIRVALKPTVYTRSGTEDNYTYTAVTDSTLKTSGVPYFVVGANGAYVSFTDITNYNNNQYLDTVNKDNGQAVLRYYTDENGYFDRQPGGGHAWEYVFAIDVNNVPINTVDKNSGNVASIVDYERNASLKDKGFVMPTCHTAGKILRYCPNCDSYEWNDISLEEYLNNMNEAADAYGTAADQKFYPAYDNETVGETVITGGKYLQKYHEATMYTCGHAECSVCKTKTHEWQYGVYFHVSLDKTYANVTTPTIDPFYGWTCWTDTTDRDRLDAYLAELKADKEFTYTFYSDAAMDDAHKMNWAPVGQPVDEDAYSQFIDVYVKAVPTVDYTIVFNTDAITNETLKATKEFKDQFETPRIVYVAQADKSQAAPAIAGYRFTFKDAEGKPFNFATFDWKNVEGDTVTIYVS